MCAAAMATVAPPLALLLLLLQLADGSFPEEPGPLSYVPVEGMCPSPLYAVGGVGAGVSECMRACAALMNGSVEDVEI